MALTNHSVLNADEMRSVEIRSDDVGLEEGYEHCLSAI